MSARTVNEALLGHPVAWVTYPNSRSIKVKNLGWLCRHIADVVRIEINWNKIALLSGCECILYATTTNGTIFSC
jgi:hypothetical protein